MAAFQVYKAAETVRLAGMKTLSLFLMALVWAGCVGPFMLVDNEIARFVRNNNVNIGKLKVGMTEAEAQAVMAQGFDPARFPSYASDPQIRDNLKGAPRIKETYRIHRGRMHVGYYYTLIQTRPGPGAIPRGRRFFIAWPLRDTRPSGYANEQIRSDKHFTPLCFVNGRLVGWGNNFLHRATKGSEGN